MKKANSEIKRLFGLQYFTLCYSANIKLKQQQVAG